MGKKSILIIPADFSSNGLARAHLIARILKAEHEVLLMGFSLNGRLWKPLEDDIEDDLTIRCVKSNFSLSDYLKKLSDILGSLSYVDVVYAVKPLLTSYGVAMLAKLKANASKLLLDISDWHLGFHLANSLKSLIKDCAMLWRVDSLISVSIMEMLARLSDDITVATLFLKRVFGGHYVPHAVDHEAYDPAKYEHYEIKEKMGLSPEDAVISFIGSPRPHKGVELIIHALNRLLKKGLSHVKFMFLGNPHDSYVKKLLYMSYELLGRDRTMFLGLRPLSEEPYLLAASDIVVVPQRRTYASCGQVPLKVFKAMSMAKPIISTCISDMPEILKGCGLVIPPDDVASLVKALEFLINHADYAERLGVKARERCITKFSLDAVKNLLLKIV
ncbi:MAG: glycosyltransferase family 4 protein [Candidatus Nezhaarchaeales archaeon]